MGGEATVVVDGAASYNKAHGGQGRTGFGDIPFATDGFSPQPSCTAITALKELDVVTDSSAMTKGKAGGRQTKSVRVWPSARRRTLWAAPFIAGPIAMVALIAVGYPLVAPVLVVPMLAVLRLVGWAEIDGQRLRHEQLIGRSTSIDFAQIREVGLGMDPGSAKKWWYPEVETIEGVSIPFVMLKSRSGKDAVASVEAIFEACMERMPDEAEDQFTNVTTSEDGELEFFLSPGYDAYLREKAENPDEGEPMVVEESHAPVQVAPIATRQPHPTFCEADSPGSTEDAPEVFTPRALTDRRKATSLTVVDDGFVERSGQDRRQAQAGALPAVVIEQPPTQIMHPTTPAPEAKASGRQFTSLFRRTS